VNYRVNFERTEVVKPVQEKREGRKRFKKRYGKKGENTRAQVKQSMHKQKIIFYLNKEP